MIQRLMWQTIEDVVLKCSDRVLTMFLREELSLAPNKLAESYLYPTLHGRASQRETKGWSLGFPRVPPSDS